MQTSDFTHFVGRMMDLQIGSTPSPDIFLRGKVIEIEETPTGPIIKIGEIVKYENGWQPWTAPMYKLDLRNIEGRKTYLEPNKLPDGIEELVLLDGRSAIVYDGGQMSFEPLKVFLSVKTFVKSFAEF